MCARATSIAIAPYIRCRKADQDEKMGQALNKLTSGDAQEIKENEIGPIIERCYDKHMAGAATKDWSSADFYRVVCETVEEINKLLGSTQFRVPKITTLDASYKKHHKGIGKTVTREEFGKIMQEVIKDAGFTGIGAKDFLFYIFGVPATALLVKQRVAPKLISNDVLIPVVTSVTVFVLAKLNKL